MLPYGFNVFAVVCSVLKADVDGSCVAAIVNDDGSSVR